MKFKFNTTSKLVIGPGEIKELSNLLELLNIKNPLIVTGPNISKTDIVKKAKTYSNTSLIFNNIQPDPTITSVEEGTLFAIDNNVDGIIGVGGGSPLDVAKLIAVLAKQNQTLESMWGVENVRSNRLPLVLIPTTSGSGSEVTPISIITTGKTQKMGVVSSIIIPDAAILDPALTLSCPKELTTYSAIDAIVHAIEGYTSRSVNNNPYSKNIALEALRYIGKSIENVILYPEDIEARGNVQYGSMLAGRAFANSPVAGIHALAYPLGGHFGIPHGLANTIILPAMLKFNSDPKRSPDCFKDYKILADALCPHMTSQGNGRETLIFVLQNLAKLGNLKIKLSDHGIDEKDIDMLADDAMKQTRLLVNNPKEITREDAYNIYKEVF